MRSFRFICACVLIGILGRAFTAQAEASTWTDLVVADCNANLHLLPSHDLFTMGIEMGLAKKAISFLMDEWRTRVTCHCPALTAADYDQFFAPTIDNVLRLLGGQVTVKDVPNCAGKFVTDWTRLSQKISFSTLPTTCSPAAFARGEPCYVKYYVSAYNIWLQLALKKCSSVPTDLPFMSLSCSGTLCKDFMKPCTPGAGHCATGLQCGPWNHAVYQTGADTVNVHTWATSMADSRQYFMKTEQCTTGGTTLNADSVGLWIFNKIMAFYSGHVGGTTSPTGVQFCGLPDVQEKWDAITPWSVFFPSTACTTQSTFETVSMACPQNSVAAWDGVLDSGVYATTAARLDGSAFPKFGAYNYNKDVFPVATYDCNNRLHLFPKQSTHMRMYLPQLNQMMKEAESILRTLQDCRTGSEKLTTDQLLARFVDFSPLLWLNTFFVHDAFALGKAMPDTMNVLKTWTTHAWNLPNGCGLYDWITKGECRLQWKGLGTLLNKDLTLRAWVRKCPYVAPETENSFEGEVTCVGTACASVLQPWDFKECQQDVDCGTGKVCKTMFGVDQAIGPKNWLWAPTTPVGQYWDYAYADELHVNFRNTGLTEAWARAWVHDELIPAVNARIADTMSWGYCTKVRMTMGASYVLDEAMFQYEGLEVCGPETTMMGYSTTKLNFRIVAPFMKQTLFQKLTNKEYYNSQRDLLQCVLEVTQSYMIDSTLYPKSVNKVCTGQTYYGSGATCVQGWNRCDGGMKYGKTQTWCDGMWKDTTQCVDMCEPAGANTLTVMNLMRNISGKPKMDMPSSGRIGYCALDAEDIFTDTLKRQAWSATAVTYDAANLVGTVAGLEAYDRTYDLPDGDRPAPDPYNPTTGAAAHVTMSVTGMALLLCALFLL